MEYMVDWVMMDLATILIVIKVILYPLETVREKLKKSMGKSTRNGAILNSKKPSTFREGV